MEPDLSGREMLMEAKILFVDDDPGLLNLYREELSEEGYKVVVARNGKEAVAKFSKENPNLVVLDIRMPEMDGITALNAILGKNRQVPVILNTAYPQYKENFMSWGADAYVVKSSDLTELKQRIREMLVPPRPSKSGSRP
jgi:two-component system, response regulator, stage 0 sporulation protein F